MDERKILIRKATPDDLKGIFYLYANYMFDSYFLRCGDSFVKEYLKTIINSKDCITLVAENSSLIGFIMATFNSGKIFSKLFFNIELLRLWSVQFLRTPCLAFEILELILYPFNTRLVGINAELLFIAIEPVYRKRELATELITQVLNSMKPKNIANVKVSTIADNDAVNALLKKNGFKFRKTFRLFKKYMYLYSFMYPPSK